METTEETDLDTEGNESEMRIGLYDVDSRVPNLALMKLSQWHRMQGDQTELYMPLLHESYDKVYASKVFDFSDGSYLREDMIVGGTGVSLEDKLPDEIESLQPDYSLYEYPHSIGFLMRGCRFKCGFCVVPRKEGRPYSNNTIENIWTQRDSDFVMLLDNDFFGNPEWEDRIEEIRFYNLKVNFSQGLNIRVLSDRQAHALASVRFTNTHASRSQVTFAWDQIKDERTILRGYHRVLSAGIKPWQMQFYVLIGYDSTREEDLHRVMTLKSLGCDPYAMPYDKSDDYQRHFVRWVNRRQIFNTCTWEEYKKTVNFEQEEGVWV